MTPNQAKLSIWTGDHSACIRIAGRANFTSSVDFKALVNELLQRGCSCLALDLSECQLMDSTFLGVLAGFGLKLSGGNGGHDPHAIELFNPSPRIIELLETMGVLHLFTTNQGAFNIPTEAQPVERTATTPTKVEVSRTCMEAHQTLMDISPANAAKFKDVTQFLADSAKRSKGE